MFLFLRENVEEEGSLTETPAEDIFYLLRLVLRHLKLVVTENGSFDEGCGNDPCVPLNSSGKIGPPSRRCNLSIWNCCYCTSSVWEPFQDATLRQEGQGTTWNAEKRWRNAELQNSK